MNERNVEALTLLLATFRTADGQTVCRVAPASIAELLASHGVLVPSALTDRQAWDMGNLHGSGTDNETAARRAYLERIAKGEEAHSGV